MRSITTSYSAARQNSRLQSSFKCKNNLQFQFLLSFWLPFCFYRILLKLLRRSATYRHFLCNVASSLFWSFKPQYWPIGGNYWPLEWIVANLKVVPFNQFRRGCAKLFVSIQPTIKTNTTMVTMPIDSPYPIYLY